MVTDTHITETQGNGDDYLDAGEEAELVLDLVNYGESATGVSATLSTDDLFLSVLSGSTVFEDMPTGEGGDNAANPFLLAASPDAPLGHEAALRLTVDSDQGQCISDFGLYLGRFHYLVWDPTPDESSGPIIAQTLADLGYAGLYSRGLPLSDELPRFSTIWACLGIRPNTVFIPAYSNLAMSLDAFILDGGCCYLEGGDVWNYDLLIGGHNYGPRFGISSPEDGDGNVGPIHGVEGIFTEGMQFDYAGENESMDRLWRMSYSDNVFMNDYPPFTLAVAHDATSFKTLGVSFEFGGLVDGEAPSTKAQLAQNIMAFFLDLPTGVEEAPSASQQSAWPNPFNPETTLRFHVDRDGELRLDIYDLKGRRLRRLREDFVKAGEVETIWDGRDDGGHDLPSGIYLARFALDDHPVAQVKLVLLK